MKKVIVVMLVVVLAFGLLLEGCSSKSSEPAKVSAPTVTVEATEEAPSPAATATTVPTEKPKDLVLPVVGNDTGKVLIQSVAGSKTYPDNSYAITSVNGECVVVDPALMPYKNVVDLNPAAIVETHNHPDHVDIIYERAYENAQLLKYTATEIKTKDFRVYGILSSHNGDTLSDSNVIMVFEVDGLRIADMADIGQTKLTDDQLKALGKIDIAFMQFENSYSDMSLKNEKGFKLIEQLNPTVIIPTGYSDAIKAALEKKYGTVNEVDNIMEFTKDDLPKGTLNVYKILNKHKYK